MKSACTGDMSPNREATADATVVHVHNVKETPKPQHVAIDSSKTPQQLHEVRDPPTTSSASDGAIDNRAQLYKSRVNNSESVASASSSESDSDILSDESTLSAETPPKTSLKGRKAAKRKRKGSNKKK